MQTCRRKREALLCARCSALSELDLDPNEGLDTKEMVRQMKHMKKKEKDAHR